MKNKLLQVVTLWLSECRLTSLSSLTSVSVNVNAFFGAGELFNLRLFSDQCKILVLESKASMGIQAK